MNDGIRKREPWTPLLKNLPNSIKFNRLSLLAQTLYVRLICQCDDGANYDADPVLLQAGLFKRMIKTGLVDLDSIAGVRDELVDVGLAVLYEHEGEQYLHLAQLKKCLRSDVNRDIRYPDYWTVKYGKSQNGDGAFQANSESETNTTPESECKEGITGAFFGGDGGGDEPQYIDYPVTSPGADDVANYRIGQDKIACYKAKYPALDVVAQLYTIREWCIDHPGRRKTAREMHTFIKDWLGQNDLELAASKCSQMPDYLADSPAPIEEVQSQDLPSEIDPLAITDTDREPNEDLTEPEREQDTLDDQDSPAPSQPTQGDDRAKREEMVQALANVNDRDSPAWQGDACRCPICADMSRSAGISCGTDGAWRFKCQACGWSAGLSGVRKMEGIRCGPRR